MNTIEINVPYSKKHLVPEIKNNGGKFRPENKTWSLADSPENRALKEMVERRVAGPSQTQRVNNIATLAVDLLNGLKYRQFKITEAGDRILIESTPITAAVTPPVAVAPPVSAQLPPVAASMPPVVDSTLVCS